jgi:hypothetical protein
VARSFSRDLVPFDDELYGWDNDKAGYTIQVNKSIFEEYGNLRVLTPEQWNDEWVNLFPHEIKRPI